MENTKCHNQAVEILLENNVTMQILNWTDTGNISPSRKQDVTQESMAIIQNVIACVGIITNSTVILVFINHKKLRRKIPNMFIINQVVL